MDAYADPRSLDSPDALAVDSLGLIASTGRAPAQLAEARAAAEAVQLPYGPDVVKRVLICGMGGSGVGGDIVAGAYLERSRVPISVHRGYYLPSWVDEHTLVVLSSYSGETEETLTCAMQVLDHQAPAVAITSGGKLATFYAERGVPVVPVPPGMQPRAALIHLMTPIVVLLGRLGALPPVEADLDDARVALEAAVAAYGPDVPTAENPAKQLARALEGGVPLVYGAEATAAVAMRWKCQFNENAKIPAFWAALPEMNHNEIVGYEGMDRLGPMAHVVMLRDPHNHRQVHRRFDFTRELIEPLVKRVFSVTGEGATALGRVLDLVLLGDYASLYLACLRGVDPGPVEMIQRLKGRLTATA
jgi:glucose/mannose-6-phosphate isomerase